MSEITVVESDAAGRPTVIDVEGEGRCEVRSWRQDAETGEWVITSYALVEPSEDWAPPVPPPPPLDVGGLLLAIFADPPVGLGKTKARAMAREYPEAQIGLDRQNWAIVRGAVADMLADEFLDTDEYARLLVLLTAHGIPEVEA